MGRRNDTDRSTTTPDMHSFGWRLGNALTSGWRRLGVGPIHLLTTWGSKSGEPRTVPVVPVDVDGRRWLVAPYGAVAWVHNVRATPSVTLRYGRSTGEYTLREAAADEAGPVLKRYVAVAGKTRPQFDAAPDEPAEAFAAEADRHPVFELQPAATAPRAELTPWASADLGRRSPIWRGIYSKQRSRRSSTLSGRDLGRRHDDQRRHLGLDEVGEALAQRDEPRHVDGRAGHGRAVEVGGGVEPTGLDAVEGGARPAGAGEDHLVLAAGVLDGRHDALGHVVVVGVHGVDVVVGLQDRLHHLEPEVGREVGRLLGDDLDAVTAELLERVGEARRCGPRSPRCRRCPGSPRRCPRSRARSARNVAALAPMA